MVMHKLAERLRGQFQPGIYANRVSDLLFLIHNCQLYSRRGLAERWDGLRKHLSAVNERGSVLTSDSELSHGTLEVRHHQSLVV